MPNETLMAEIMEGLDRLAEKMNEGERMNCFQNCNSWISVNDRLPECFRPVILCYRGIVVEQGFREPDGRWKVYGARVKGVTHWMPLPEPPEEVQSDE